MADVTLKPCPFCQGKAEIERMGNSRVSMIITCEDCGASLETGEEFLSDTCCWNTRPAPQPSEGDREKVAAWMIKRGLATGHGDTLDDLLAEATWQVEELRARLAASRVPEWRTIDSAPKDGTDILIYCDGWYVAHWNSVSELWYFPEDGCAIDPTHWQPLPAAPAPEVPR